MVSVGSISARCLKLSACTDEKAYSFRQTAACSTAGDCVSVASKHPVISLWRLESLNRHPNAACFLGGTLPATVLFSQSNGLLVQGSATKKIGKLCRGLYLLRTVSHYSGVDCFTAFVGIGSLVCFA